MERSFSSKEHCNGGENIVEMDEKCKEEESLESSMSPKSPFRKQNFNKVTFVNNKRHSSTMMTPTNVEKLHEGKEIQLYQSHSLSVLKVPTFTSKTKILKETPRNSK